VFGIGPVGVDAHLDRPYQRLITKDQRPYFKLVIANG